MKAGPTFPGIVQALGFVLIAGTVTACASVRRFLIPPPRGTEVSTAQPKPQRAGHLADLVLYVGQIQGAQAGETAIAMRDGRLLARGTPAQMQPLLAPTTRTVRQSGAVLLPGFVDAHVHLDGASLIGDAADLRKAGTAADVEAALKDARSGFWTATNASGADWQWGFGLSPHLFSQLSVADLDRMADGVPVYLSRADGHGGLVNGALIKQLPKDLEVLAVAAAGRLNESLARRVWQHLPSPRAERWKPLLMQTLRDLQQRGWTEVHAMGATAGLRDTLVDLESEGRLPIRVKLFLDGELPEAQALLHPPPPPPLRDGEPRTEVPVPAWKRSRLTQVVGVKFWLDGTLGGRSAALSMPYADDPGQGALAMTDLALANDVTAADKAGLQVAVHAIGDAAVAQVARVLAGLKRPTDALPVRIEHSQVVSPDTLERLAGLNVACSVQPLHAQDDSGFSSQRLGPARRAWAYRLASLARVCPLLAGSDLPLSASEPLLILETMHLAPDRMAGERLDRDKAMRALLPGGMASAQPLPQPGESVDLVLWSRDPLLPGPPPEVLAVVVDGQVTVLTLNDRAVPE